MAGAHDNYGAAPPEVLERVRRLQEICAQHGVALPTAALQFPAAHPAVATVLLGVVDPGSLERNLAGLAAPIPAALWDALMEAGLLRQELRAHLEIGRAHV